MYATYNICDDRLKLFPEGEHIPEEQFKAGRSLGLAWWRGSKCLTGVWSPAREDFILQFVDEIQENDSPDDVEGRIERFQKYAENDLQSAEYAQERVLNANTPRQLAQAERIALKKLDEARYWNQRIAGAIRNRAYKDKPDVITRRIKGLQKDERKQKKLKDESVKFLGFWKKVEILLTSKETGESMGIDFNAKWLANRDPLHFSMCFSREKYNHDGYEGEKHIWSALEDEIINGQQAKEIMINAHTNAINHAKRWLKHLSMRIEYETEYLKAMGGSESMLAKKPRRKSVAPDDGLEKEQIIYAGYGASYLRAKLLTLSAKSCRVDFLDRPDIMKHYPKGYQVGRRFIKKELPQ